MRPLDLNPGDATGVVVGTETKILEAAASSIFRRRCPLPSSHWMNTGTARHGPLKALHLNLQGLADILLQIHVHYYLWWAWLLMSIKFTMICAKYKCTFSVIFGLLFRQHRPSARSH